MIPDEFVFSFPGDPERRILTFAEMDEILLADIHDWEDRVRAGFVEVFIKKHDTEHPLKSIGKICLVDIRRKFG